MESRDVFVLETIIELCDRIQDSVKRYGDDFAIYEKDLDFQDACNMRIVQIGENVSSLSETFKTAHSQIPWRNIVGTRNILVHDYGSISNAKVWAVIREDIPKLRNFCVSTIS